MAKVRVLRNLKLDEISAVDKPAQEGALMTLMKRHIAPDQHPSVTALGKTLDRLIVKSKQELVNMKRADANTLIKSAGDIFTADQERLANMPKSMLAKKDAPKPLSRHDALQKARRENPEGYAAMNSLPAYTFTGLHTGTEVVKREQAFDLLTTQIKLAERCTHAEAMQKAYAQVQEQFAKGEPELGDFEQIVAGIRKAKGSSRAEALKQARRENPEAFAQWQG